MGRSHGEGRGSRRGIQRRNGEIPVARVPRVELVGDPEVVYGIEAICRIIHVASKRRAYFLLEKKRVPGAWKLGDKTWALTVPVWRRAVGLDAPVPPTDKPDLHAA